MRSALRQPVRGDRGHAGRGLRLAAAIAIGTCLAPLAALAQQVVPPASLPPITELSRPAFPGEFPLYPARKGGGPGEQWNTYLGGSIVRNVVNPTIIPVLPDPAKRNGTAIVFAPGGGFKYLGMDNPEVKLLVDQGISVFVLKYRTDPTDRDPKAFLTDLYRFLFDMTARNRAPDAVDAAPFHATREAIEDGLAAVRLIRSRAGEWGIDPKRLGFMGGSAGAMTAIDVGYTDDAAARPDFLIAMIGPKKVAPVPPTAPPLFYVASIDDPLFPGATENIVSAWDKAKRPIEAHFYERGGHGLAKGTTAGPWFDGLVLWLRQHGWIAAPK